MVAVRVRNGIDSQLAGLSAQVGFSGRAAAQGRSALLFSRRRRRVGADGLQNEI
jgi:hypothetical protein